MDVVLAEAAHVRGKVVDESGNPVSGAKVNAGGSATTDAQGNYLIKRVPTGARTITGEAAGYLKTSLSVTLVKEIIIRLISYLRRMQILHLQ